MSKIAIEIDSESLIDIIKKLPEGEKEKIRELIRPKNHWLRRLYDLYLPVRKEAQKYEDEEIERDIKDAIREVRKTKG